MRSGETGADEKRLHYSAEEIETLFNPRIRGLRQYHGLRKAQDHLAKLDW